MSRALDLIDRRAQDELLRIRSDLVTVYREIQDGRPELFPLRYARSTPREVEIHDAVPVLVLPDGPGTASVLPYDVLRRLLVGDGVDVLMMEHRGVGLSRLDARGRDLPPAAMDLRMVLGDILAVLDHARVPRAAVYGVGYGAYLAQALAALHPQRVHALVLDSPLTSSQDEAIAQRAVRQLYWLGTERTDSIAAVLRRLDAAGDIDAITAGPVLATVHEFGGIPAVRELVDLLALGRGRLSFDGVHEVLTQRWLQSTPYLQELDLLAPISSGQLGAGRHADGGPLDPLALDAEESRRTPFRGEPWDLHELSARITAPTLVLCGADDLITPPCIADRLVARIPGARRITVPHTTHSLLDSHSSIARVAARWAAVGAPQLLADRADDLVRLPPAPLAQLLQAGVRVALAAERYSPWKLRLERARLSRLEQLMDPSSRRVRRVTVP